MFNIPPLPETLGELDRFHRPNLRDMFVPDPGYTIFDADLSGADAQVVAWEANDEDLKAAFRAGLKIHHKNAEDMWGRTYTHGSEPARKRMYKEIKQGVHGTNYGGSARTIARTLGWTVHEADMFQHRWFDIHPAIRDWHRRTDATLQASRTITNAYGYRIIFFDRTHQDLPKALAWTPQSTVAINCFEGAILVDDALNPPGETPKVEWLLQVHDSLVFQIKTHLVPEVLPQMAKLLPNPVPYPDPLIIPWEVACSTESWGQCEEIPWPEAA